MFNFFKKSNDNDSNTSKSESPEWLKLVQENQERYFVFLDKLKAKAIELADAALPELQALKVEDERQHGLMLNGILGQLENIRDKANDVYQEKIEDVYQKLNNEVPLLDPYYKKLSKFRSACSDKLYNDLESEISKLRYMLKQTEFTDYEVIYKQILDEHESIKNRFKCQQCGDTIPLTKIYFVTTHIACPSCQNKNTFTPSSLAQGLEHIGRSLAEQRTKPLLQKYYHEKQREEDLFAIAHNLKLKQNFDKNEKDLTQKIAIAEENYKTSKQLTSKFYSEYEREMFDEWKRLVPDLAEHIERFYLGQQNRKF